VPGSATVIVSLALGGCQWFVEDADREVYRLVDKRQLQAVGVAHEARLETQRVPIHPAETAYEFVPHPVQTDVPASFKVAAVTTAPAPLEPKSEDQEEPVDTAPPGTGVSGRGPTSVPASQPAAAATRPAAPEDRLRLLEVDKGAERITLSGALVYAFQHARDFQNAKEDLYLAALALTLERHLWTPQLVGEITSNYVNYGEIRHFDQAMDAVSRVAVEQRLPYGGRLAAEVISTLLRDLTNNITTGESGQALLTAEIPLLKGAGRVAYESRYQAERQLIYAVRTFERFRRALAVSVASDYFDLQQLRQQIVNAAESIDGLEWLSARARAFFNAGISTILDVQRAEQDLLLAQNQLVNAVENYRNALDIFKIRIGMPTQTRITVPSSELATTHPASATSAPGETESLKLIEELEMPAVDEKEAVRVALKYRLDLLNDLDRIGDAERGVVIAENAILPALDAFGSVQFDTEPDRLGMFDYETDRATWRGGLTLELPLDRKAERNALRESLIVKQRAQRDYEQARDTVVQQVRRAMRRVEQQRQSLQIQIVNRRLAQRRVMAAQFKFQRGQLPSFEVVDAQNQLLLAQNLLAQAQADYKVAILEFWRDTDMLRIDDEGHWEMALAPPPSKASR